MKRSDIKNKSLLMEGKGPILNRYAKNRLEQMDAMTKETDDVVKEETSFFIRRGLISAKKKGGFIMQ